MNKVSIAGMFLGLLILAALLLWNGIHNILHLLVNTGWLLLALPLVWAPSQLVATVSWRQLFPATRTPSLIHLLIANWMGRAVNILLPVATIGGEVVKARLITLWEGNGVDVSASVMVDKTVQALALVPWGFIGAGLLFYLALDNGIAVPVIIGITALAAGVGGFILVQHFGMFGFLANLTGRFLHAEKRDGLTNGAGKVDQAVRNLYRQRRKFGAALFCRTLSLMLESSEIWLACYLMGQPLGLLETLALESLTSTVNNVVFFIPNAYGVQEGGFVVIGSLFGLTPDFSLALSLATRIREVVIDLPGLLFWQYTEGRRLIGRKPGNP